MMSKLIYIGNGGALIGVPARDLTEEEVKQLEKDFDIENLIKSGLYRREGDFDEKDAAKVLPHITKKKAGE